MTYGAEVYTTLIRRGGQPRKAWGKQLRDPAVDSAARRTPTSNCMWILMLGGVEKQRLFQVPNWKKLMNDKLL